MSRSRLSRTLQRSRRSSSILSTIVAQKVKKMISIGQEKIIPLEQQGTPQANDGSFSFFQIHTVYTAEKSGDVAISCGR